LHISTDINAYNRTYSKSDYYPYSYSNDYPYSNPYLYAYPNDADSTS
jgi:hypothetical protein